jgi:hypothetical protein
VLLSTLLAGSVRAACAWIAVGSVVEQWLSCVGPLAVFEERVCATEHIAGCVRAACAWIAAGSVVEQWLSRVLDRWLCSRSVWFEELVRGVPLALSSSSGCRVLDRWLCSRSVWFEELVRGVPLALSSSSGCRVLDRWLCSRSVCVLLSTPLAVFEQRVCGVPLAVFERRVCGVSATFCVCGGIGLLLALIIACSKLASDNLT